MYLFDLLLGNEFCGPGPDSVEATIITAYQATQEWGGETGLGF
jgi:hypothetical protein